MQSELMKACRRYMWTITIPISSKGMTIWSTWTLSKVNSLMNSPPQNQYITVLPRMGITDTMLLKTVRPQKDIWVIGSTYPRKVRTISSTKIIQPEPRASHEDSKARPYIKVLEIWVKISNQITLAIELCPRRSIDPNSLSLTSYMILKESFMLLEYIQHSINPRTT